MKRFFEEYGGVSLGILAVLVLIAIVNPVGGGIKNSLTGITKGFDNKMTNGLNNSGTGFGDSTPEQTISLTTGQKITIANKEYTVIENVEGNQYKVLATNTLQHKFDANSNSNNYATSEIATYLDGEYYDSLDASIKDAIVETPIQQKISSIGYDNGKNSPTWTGEVKEGGTHKVFLPSWDEVTKVYGTTPDKLNAYTPTPNSWTWLRDIYSSLVLHVFSNGRLSNSSPNCNGYVRPAFVLDLSKVEYTTK